MPPPQSPHPVATSFLEIGNTSYPMSRTKATDPVDWPRSPTRDQPPLKTKVIQLSSLSGPGPTGGTGWWDSRGNAALDERGGVVETRTRITSPHPIVGHSHPGLSLTSCNLCTSLEGSVGGKWSRKACCFSCRKEGANLWDEHGGAGERTLVTNPSLKSTGWLGEAWSCPSGGPLPSCGSPAQNPSVPYLQDPTPPHSLIITDADDWPHQEPSFCPPPPPPARWHSQVPRLCLLWALAVNDAEEHIDGSLGRHAAGALSHNTQCWPTHSPTHWAIIQEAHRGGSIDLVNDQAIGLPTSTQHRLHLCSSLDMRAEGLRAAVITGTVRRGRGYQGSSGLGQGSSQCPWQDGPPGPCCHTYTLRIPHKKTPNPSDLRRGVVHSQCPWDPSPTSNPPVFLTQPDTSRQKRNPVTRPSLSLTLHSFLPHSTQHALQSHGPGWSCPALGVHIAAPPTAQIYENMLQPTPLLGVPGPNHRA